MFVGCGPRHYIRSALKIYVGLHLNIVRFATKGFQGKLNELINMFPHLLDNLYFLLGQDGRGHKDLRVIHLFTNI